MISMYMLLEFYKDNPILVSEWFGVKSLFDIISVSWRREQGSSSSMAWSVNKVVYVGVGVYVLDPPYPSPTSLYTPSPLKHHPTGKQWCPNQTIILTPRRPYGL